MDRRFWAKKMGKRYEKKTDRVTKPEGKAAVVSRENIGAVVQL